MSDIAAFRASLIAFLCRRQPSRTLAAPSLVQPNFLSAIRAGNGLCHHIRRGDIFVTRSRTPYEVRFRSPAGEELETIAIHVGIDSFRTALEAIYPGNASEVEVIDFFGRDVALSHLCGACADLLSAHVPGSSRIVSDLTQLFATYLAEKYTSATSGKPEVRGGLPIRQLQKVGDFVTEHLAEEISVEILAQLVQLSPFHFSRIFKQSTGMSPLRFVTRERVTRAQQLIRETSRSHRDRARGGLHEPEPFRSSVPACGWCDAYGSSAASSSKPDLRILFTRRFQVCAFAPVLLYSPFCLGSNDRVAGPESIVGTLLHRFELERNGASCSVRAVEDGRDVAPSINTGYH
jgi:AraC-like DNA-binding protein